MRHVYLFGKWISHSKKQRDRLTNMQIQYEMISFVGLKEVLNEDLQKCLFHHPITYFEVDKNMICHKLTDQKINQCEHTIHTHLLTHIWRINKRIKNKDYIFR